MNRLDSKGGPNQMYCPFGESINTIVTQIRIGKAGEVGVVWVATSGNFQFRSDFPAEKSSIDQTRGYEHDLMLGGVRRGGGVLPALGHQNGNPD
jgi:hypothetical protein